MELPIWKANLFFSIFYLTIAHPTLPIFYFESDANSLLHFQYFIILNLSKFTFTLQIVRLKKKKGLNTQMPNVEIENLHSCTTGLKHTWIIICSQSHRMESKYFILGKQLPIEGHPSSNSC